MPILQHFINGSNNGTTVSLGSKRCYEFVLSQFDDYNMLNAGAPVYLVKHLWILINKVANVVSGHFMFQPYKWLYSWCIPLTSGSSADQVQGCCPCFQSTEQTAAIIPYWSCCSVYAGITQAWFELRLVIPQYCNEYNECAFAVACQLLWNKLPLAKCVSLSPLPYYISN